MEHRYASDVGEAIRCRVGMKILYLAPIRLPTEKAHGIQIMETCAALSRAGANLTLLVSTRKTIPADPFEYYNVARTFFIERVRTLDIVRYGRVGYALFVTSYIVGVLWSLRKSRPDVLYTRDPITASAMVLLTRRPVILEAHTAHTYIPLWILHRLAGVITITHGLRDYYVRDRKVSERSVYVAPDAVDVAPFEEVEVSEARRDLRKRLSVSPESKVALYTGSFGLYAWKGVDVAREAADRDPHVTWLFVGGSVDECGALTRGAANHVRTLPRVSRKDMPKLLMGADVLLLPNKSGDLASERDTSPMKLFEYMASGVPIVASDIPSIREVLDETCAFLVVPNDAAALAQGVREALSSGESSRRAAEARKRSELYTWDKRASGIVGFLEGVI